MKKLIIVMSTAFLVITGCSSSSSKTATPAVQEVKEPAPAPVEPIKEVEPVEEIVKKPEFSISEEAAIREYFLALQINMTGTQQGLYSYKDLVDNPSTMSYGAFMEVYDVFVRMYDNMEYNPIPQVQDKEVQDLLDDIDFYFRMSLDGLISSTFDMAMAVEMDDLDSLGRADESMTRGMEQLEQFISKMEELKALVKP